MSPTSYLVAVDGVSSVLRDKFLKVLQQEDNVKVHTVEQFHIDLEEMMVHNDDTNAALLYARRIKYDEQFVNSIDAIHVFDRLPASILLYQLLKIKDDNNFTDKAKQLVSDLKMNDICANYKCFILLDVNRHKSEGLAKILNFFYGLLAYKLMGDYMVLVCEIDENSNHDQQAAKFLQQFNNQRYNWKTVRTCHIYRHNFPRTTCLLAGFDLDNTLIMTRSRQLFPEDRHDWQFKYDKEIIKHKLRRLLYAGFMLVVFTNQNGIQFGHISLQDMTGKINDILRELDLPMMVVMATFRDFFRKPHTGMMDLIVEKMPKNVSRRKWFFIGDNVNGTSFDDSDFAEATGIQFINDSNFFNMNIMVE